MAIQIDVVVGVIDRVDEKSHFVHFVGMPIAPCFKVDDELVRAAPPDCIAGL